MSKVKRREFLMIASSISLLGIMPLPVLSDSNKEVSAPVAELLVVLQVWLNEVKESPSDYLAGRRIDCDDKTQVKKISESDFRTGNTIAVRGIVLSKTEAAIVSQFAIHNFCE